MRAPLWQPLAAFEKVAHEAQLAGRPGAGLGELREQLRLQPLDHAHLRGVPWTTKRRNSEGNTSNVHQTRNAEGNPSKITASRAKLSQDTRL